MGTFSTPTQWATNVDGLAKKINLWCKGKIYKYTAIYFNVNRSSSCFNQQFSSIEKNVMEEKESIGKVKRQRVYFEYPEGTQITYIDRYMH